MVKPVMHIVRRFGPVGGMEKYVWELTHALLELGVNVEVLCEKVMQTPDPRIRLHVVGPFPEKPRWKSMLAFRSGADVIVQKEINHRSLIVHSHERSIHHHVTTFHGPPMVANEILWGIPIFNRRIQAWKEMEHDEIFGPNLKFFLPVSNILKNTIHKHHDESRKINCKVAWPGVHNNFAPQRPDRKRSAYQFLFVGKEWKRKGLICAVKIVENMRGAKLDVYGVTEEEIPSAILNSPVVRIVGRVSNIPWRDYDALIHPARNEPFGMVVSEARQFGTPVLLSSNTGAAELEFEGMRMCAVSDPVSIWTEALHELLADSKSFQPEIPWTWTDLAHLLIKDVYPKCLV